MNYRRLTTTTLSASVVGLVAVALPMDNVSAMQSFKDKTMTVVVPSGSGGTFHIYCQLVQRHMGRHMEGIAAVHNCYSLHRQN